MDGHGHDGETTALGPRFVGMELAEKRFATVQPLLILQHISYAGKTQQLPPDARDGVWHC
jgi:hypothetical protein